MAIDWIKALHPVRAVGNLRTEMTGDWHRDPWAWPEYDFLLRGHLDWLLTRASSHGLRRVAQIDVPKENFEAAYSPDHPDVARTLGNLGIVQQQMGELAGARATQERALAILGVAYGPDHPDVARTLGNLGTAQEQMGELAGARATLERALAIEEAAYGPDHLDVASALTNLGSVQQQMRELAGARTTRSPMAATVPPAAPTPVICGRGWQIRCDKITRYVPSVLLRTKSYD